MHSVQYQPEFENQSTYPQNPTFIKKLSFDEMSSPVYGLMEEHPQDFEIENMLVGKNKIPSDPQSQNFCFRKLQFDIGDETDDIFFSTPETSHSDKVTSSAEFITSSEVLEVSDFTLHCGPQETPVRNHRDYSISKRIGRDSCDDLLVSISRTDSEDIFRRSHTLCDTGRGNDMMGSPMNIESEDVVECTPTKFLPTSKNLRNRGLNAITPQTLVDFIGNSQNHSYLIVDCRYEYEYNGGHIQGAVHVETPAMLETLFVTYRHLLFNRESLEHIKENFALLQSHPHLINSISATNPNDYCVPVIIFHCEFSQKRGPRALRMLREIDRQLNYNDFPNLYYPEVYILEGGYSNFFRTFPEYCLDTYIKMVDERYKSMYQQARQKEKRCWEVKPSFGKLLTLQRSKTLNFL